MAEVSCNLEGLKFCDCTFAGPQLVKFVQSPAPRLRDLCLSRVKGVLNGDMLNMFLIVAPTLNTLTLDSCKIDRSPNEEFAIDAAVSKMVSLQCLYITGNCGTELSILRAGTIYREAQRNAYNPLPHISLCYAPEINPKNLPEALRVTNWVNIIVWADQMSSADESLKQELLKIAATRGIGLVIEY
jgi:hypothetical protein